MLSAAVSLVSAVASHLQARLEQQARLDDCYMYQRMWQRLEQGEIREKVGPWRFTITSRRGMIEVHLR